ncbi:MAG TPA: type II toxin-antitoxin system VapC family toxin [Opitutaceae bacterium]|nr:type II toxin-antitoxin system VapC family toxin [Opitutaceae bacterium]
MSGRYLFDTSFLIDLINETGSNHTGAARRYYGRLAGGSRFFASIVSLSELVEGADDPGELAREFHAIVHCLGLHQQHGIRAGLLQRHGREQGRRMGENDAWIAATATLGDLTLVGDDDAAFAGRPGLDYVNFRSNHI